MIPLQKKFASVFWCLLQSLEVLESLNYAPLTDIEGLKAGFTPYNGALYVALVYLAISVVGLGG